MLIRANIRFKQLFKKYLTVSSTTTYNSGNGSYTYTPSRYIYFYDWDNALINPKIFRTVDDFLSYVKHNNLSITNEQIRYVRNNNWVYLSCSPGTPFLVLDIQYTKLRERMIELTKSSYTMCTSLSLVK